MFAENHAPIQDDDCEKISDVELKKISQRLMEKNKEAYEVLAQ
jgi:hypothetical protein